MPPKQWDSYKRHFRDSMFELGIMMHDINEIMQGMTKYKDNLISYMPNLKQIGGIEKVMQIIKLLFKKV